MINEIKNEAENRMKKAIDALKAEFSRLRTGRASVGIIEHIMVDYYGSPTQIGQVANITVADARTLMITPWEKQMVPAIEKAIINSDLGLNPATAGLVIRVPMPALSEERRKELTKLVRAEAENARVSVRNARRDANQAVKDLLKDKSITEDEGRQTEERIQKLTDHYIKEVDQLTETKEADMMVL